jgi:ribosome biogenesis protein Nip4
VTDLFNAHDRDVRTFNKNSERKNYFVTNPEDHYLNGNDITDEFGMKVTFCHPKLAIVIVDWLYKKNDNNEEKQQILDFINYFMDKV